MTTPLIPNPQALSRLTEKICKAVPEINDWYCHRCNRAVDGQQVTFNEEHDVCGSRVSAGRPTTLEDVLRALRESKPELNPMRYNKFASMSDTRFHPLYWEASVLKMWNLGKPLSEQSPETIEFLDSLF